MQRSLPRGVMAGAGLALCVCALVGTPARASQPVAHMPSAPAVNVAAFRGQGALAFVWADRLYLLNGDNGTLTSVPQAGVITEMAWSAAGRWLAYIAAASTTNPYLGGPLWVVRRDGSGARRVAGAPTTASTFSWSPVADTLAVGTSPGATGATSLWLATPAGRAHQISDAAAGVWSPDGATLAYGATLPFISPEGRSDALYTAPVAGGAARSRYTSKGLSENKVFISGGMGEDDVVPLAVEPIPLEVE